MNKKIIFSLGLIALLSGCIFSSDNDKKKDDAKNDSSKRIFVVTSDYQTGELRWLNASEDSLVSEGLAIHQDSRVKGRDDMLLILESYGKDNLLRLSAKDPGKKSVAYQVSLAENANPLDAVFPANDTAHAYVAQGGSAHLLKVKLSTGKAIDSLDLGKFSDPSNDNPAMQSLLVSGDTLFVTLQRRGADYSVTLNGLMALIDLKNFKLLDTVDLQLKNPSAMVVQGNNIIVACSGTLPWEGDVPGDSTHAVVAVDRSTKKITTLAYDKALGGAPQNIEYDAKNEIFYIAVYKSYGNTKLVSMPAQGGKVTTIDGVEDAFGGLAFDSKTQKLYIGDRGMSKPGLKVYANGKLSTLYTGSALPIYNIHIANW